MKIYMKPNWFANIILGEIVLNILNATTTFDDKYIDVQERIQYIEMCANYCILFQVANLASQFLYFVLTTIQNMNLGRTPKSNKKRGRMIEDEIYEDHNGRKETWL